MKPVAQHAAATLEMEDAAAWYEREAGMGDRFFAAPAADRRTLGLLRCALTTLWPRSATTHALAGAGTRVQLPASCVIVGPADGLSRRPHRAHPAGASLMKIAYMPDTHFGVYDQTTAPTPVEVADAMDHGRIAA